MTNKNPPPATPTDLDEIERNHSEACSICPDCGLLPWIPHRNPSCTGQGNAFCKDNTIARLRSELASLRALSDAERAVVEAAILRYNWNMAVQLTEGGNKFKYAATRKCEIEAIGRLGDVTAKLIAIRAREPPSPGEKA